MKIISNYSVIFVIFIFILFSGCNTQDPKDLLPEHNQIEEDNENKLEDQEYDGVPSEGVLLLDKNVLSSITYPSVSYSDEFHYDSFGRLISYKGYSASGPPFTLTIDYDKKNFKLSGYYEGTGEIKFNKRGYITSLKRDRHNGISEGKWEFTYDDDIHLKDIKFSQDGLTTYYSLNWNGNKLMSCGKTGTYWIAHNFTYGTSDNKFEQYSHHSALIDDEINYLMIAGLLGKGPGKAITQIETSGSEFKYITPITQFFSEDGKLMKEESDQLVTAEYEYTPICLPSDNNQNEDNNDDNDIDDGDKNLNTNINKELLCKNDGIWEYRRSYSWESPYSYFRFYDRIIFYNDNTIKLYSEYYTQGKNLNGSGYYSHLSYLDAKGKYSLIGNQLKCEFTYVSFGGYNPNSIWGEYWVNGETNIKNYTIEYDEEVDELTLRSGGEELFLKQSNGNNSGSGDNGSGTGSGNGSENESDGTESTTYEKPELYFQDSTLGTNSITVKFRVDNKERCGTLSNAKVYYGTTSASKAVSATLSGSLITAKITGLSKDTKYKIKCSVTGSGGMSTSSEILLSTLP